MNPESSMWPFSKKWSAPAPRLAMVVSLTHQELPSLIMLANPAGAEGSVPGMAGPADAKPTAENMTGPIQEGQYVALSPGGGGCSLRVERVKAQSEGLSLDPAIMANSG